MDIVHFNEYYLPKISSGLSIMGSSIVLIEIGIDIRCKHKISSVSRMLAHVSMGDILFSLAWFLGTWAAPSDLDYLDDTNHGSYQSCRFQGFLLQLGGFTTMIFNPLLAVIYLLMINYNWRETKLYKLEVTLQAIVWTMALILAILPLPMDSYHNGGMVCQIDSYPYNCTETWMLDSEDETMTTTDCTAGDNAGFFRRIITLFTACGGIISTYIMFYFMYRKMRNLELESESIAIARQQQQHHQHQQQQGNSLPSYSATAVPNGTNQSIDDHGSDPTLTTHTGTQPFFVLEETQDTKQEDDDDDEDDSSSSRVDDDDLESEMRPSSTVATSTVASQLHSRKGSRIVAREGVLYTAGFLLLFAPWMVSVVVFLVSGSWNGPLDRASVFFATIQGMWNLCVFSRRRHMRTSVGKQVSKLLRIGPYVTNALTTWTTGTKKRSLLSFGGWNSSNSPHHPKSKDECCAGVVIHGGPLRAAAAGRGGDQQRRQHQQRLPSQQQPMSDAESGFLIQWKQSQIQDVSELGASEVCYTEPSEKWDSSSRDNHDCTSPPYQPIRARSEESSCSSVSSYGSEKYPGSIRSSASASSRTRSHYSKNNSNDSLDSAPVRPIRTISEVSALESIDENLEMTPSSSPTSPSNMDCPPFRPIRITSEITISELESIDEEYHLGMASSDSSPTNREQVEDLATDSVPSHPIRIESEYEEEADDASGRLSDSLPPRKPNRWDSEIEETREEETDGAGECSSKQRVSDSSAAAIPPFDSSSTMPQQPSRFASEIDHSSSSEEEEEKKEDNNTPVSSSSATNTLPHQPSRCISEMEEIEEGTTTGDSQYSTSRASFNSDSLPRQPKRCASEVEDFDC